MRFVSTRTKSLSYSFEDALLTGYSEDGGLLFPETIPSITEQQLKEWKTLSYTELALALSSLFISASEIPRDDLKRILEDSFKEFRHKDVVAVERVKDMFIAELFHGPTLAFKDIALQVVSNLCNYFLLKRKKRMTVITERGPAAISGARGKASMECFVLFPIGRISAMQERQMTTVTDSNIHVIGMDGTSDDLDDVVKRLFEDQEFKNKYNVCSINSINVGRIIFQMVHYFFAYFRAIEKIQHKEELPKVVFAVPTGAFGNGVAGILSKKMGLPLDRLIVATNENDILYRFSSSGVFARGAVVPTVAPAIDIQVPYNFERFLYMMCDENADKVRAWMEEFEKHGKLTLDKELLTRSAQFIRSLSIHSSDTLKTIGEYYKQHKYLLDPHTAVGVTAALRLKHDRVIDETLTCICLATAHPGKFQDAITKAVGEEVPLPAVLAQLQSLPTQSLSFSADKQQAELKLRQLISSAF